MAVASSSVSLDASQKNAMVVWVCEWVTSLPERLNLERCSYSFSQASTPWKWLEPATRQAACLPPWTHRIPLWWPPAWSVRPAPASPSRRSAWLPPRPMSASCLEHLQDERGEGEFSSCQRGPGGNRDRQRQTKFLVQSQRRFAIVFFFSSYF